MNAIEILKKYEDVIKQRYYVKKIGIFGSFARGEETEGSDIDVLVDLKDGYETFDNFMDLKYFLEDLFNRKVDLVTIDALRPQLKDDILQEVIYTQKLHEYFGVNYKIMWDIIKNKLPNLQKEIQSILEKEK